MSDTIKLPTDHHGAMSMVLGAASVSPPSYEEAIAIYLRARGVLNDDSALLGASIPADWNPQQGAQ